MGYKFNPLTGQFDLVNNSSSGGGGDVVGPASSIDGDIAIFDGVTGKLLADSGISISSISPNFTATFNATTDWAGPAGGSYTITILKATHLKDAPVVQLFELNAPDYIVVETGIRVDPSDNVFITVNSTPDLRFAGKISLS